MPLHSVGSPNRYKTYETRAGSTAKPASQNEPPRARDTAGAQATTVGAPGRLLPSPMPSPLPPSSLTSSSLTSSSLSAAPRPAAAAQDYIEQAKHHFAVGRGRQAFDALTRAISVDRYSTDACLDAVWEQPAVGQLPNLLRHVLTRFEAQDPAYRIYQWLLALALHAKGSRPQGMRVLGQAINSVTDGMHPQVGSSQVPTCDHWLRQHDMASATSNEFWTGAAPTATAAEAITSARRALLNILSLADEHLDDTLPVLKSITGAQRHVLATLDTPQILRLLTLHAAGREGVALAPDEVRAMVQTLTPAQRQEHLAEAVSHGNAFHTTVLMDAGASLHQVPRDAVNSSACRDPWIVEQLLGAGESVERLADLLMQPVDTDTGLPQPVAAKSLEVLLAHHLSPDHRTGGQSVGPTLLWEAVRRKDTAAVALLRDYRADPHVICHVTHTDGSTGVTTPGIFALAQGDALTLRAMRMADAEALLPGIEMVLSAVATLA